MRRRVASMRVSYDVLKEVLHLPPETMILAVEDDPFKGFTFRILLEHPDFPEVDTEVTSITREVSPSFITKHCVHDVVRFGGWSF